MNDTTTLAKAALTLLSLLGCAPTDHAKEEGRTADTSAALTDNALEVNAIDLNGLVSNAIDLNGLTPQSFSPSALASIQNSGQLGAYSRKFLRYLVSCALDEQQSFSFTWTDDLGVVHPEVYPGSLGLATNWATGALSTNGRQWVSACIAARTNYYGLPVIISIRGTHAAIKDLGVIEQADYPMEEGAFWGDLFSGTPTLFSCHHATNDAHSRSKLRECAAGHVGPSGLEACGMIQLFGECDDVCDPLDTTEFTRHRCYENGNVHQVISVFLP